VGTISRTRRAWYNMHTRISHSHKYPHWHVYRGHTIDPRWEEYETFLADMGECPEGHQLDRTDGSRGYSPDNCRWVTPSQNARNRNTNRYLTNPRTGETLLVVEWMEKLGLGVGSIQNRLHRYGWTLDRTLNTARLKKKEIQNDLSDRVSPQPFCAAAC
jgi:hypothetical protein